MGGRNGKPLSSKKKKKEPSTDRYSTAWVRVEKQAECKGYTYGPFAQQPGNYKAVERARISGWEGVGVSCLHVHTLAGASCRTSPWGELVLFPLTTSESTIISK